MNEILRRVHTEIFVPNGLKLTNFKEESESQEYGACRFDLNEKKIICRNAKITPKKAGQFVTFWKRNRAGIIEPLHENDPIDYFLVNVTSDTSEGQFIFPKAILVKNGIISTNKKEGKRAFRVYTSWDKVNSKQAEKTQKWQLDYFYDAHEQSDIIF